jgi:hypothetical protein
MRTGCMRRTIGLRDCNAGQLLPSGCRANAESSHRLRDDLLDLIPCCPETPSASILARFRLNSRLEDEAGTGNLPAIGCCRRSVTTKESEVSSSARLCRQPTITQRSVASNAGPVLAEHSATIPVTLHEPLLWFLGHFVLRGQYISRCKQSTVVLHWLRVQSRRAHG